MPEVRRRIYTGQVGRYVLLRGISKVTDAEFARRLARAASAHHRGGWRPALLAYQAREAGVPLWAQKIGRHPGIRRSPKTIYHWAQAAAVARSFIPDIGKAVYLLPVSVWLSLAPYEAEHRKELIDMIEAFIAEQGVSVEELRAQLAQAFGPPDKALCDLLDAEHSRLIHLCEKCNGQTAAADALTRAAEYVYHAKVWLTRD